MRVWSRGWWVFSKQTLPLQFSFGQPWSPVISLSLGSFSLASLSQAAEILLTLFALCCSPSFLYQSLEKDILFHQICQATPFIDLDFWMTPFIDLDLWILTEANFDQTKKLWIIFCWLSLKQFVSLIWTCEWLSLHWSQLLNDPFINQDLQFWPKQILTKQRNWIIFGWKKDENNRCFPKNIHVFQRISKISRLQQLKEYMAVCRW